MSDGDLPQADDDTAPLPRPRRTLRQRLLLGSGAVVVAAILVVALVFGYVWWRYSQIERQDLALAQPVSGEPLNYLIVGSDDRAVISEDDPNADGFLNGDVEPAGHRSDTIMVARVDPEAGTVDLVSFPRDLWVPIAGTSGSERINTAYNSGPQRLIDTIQQNFGIEINHYVEIDFASFKGIVEAVDGVPMEFHTAMRDRNSGLVVGAGCVVLDGDQALAFARARHLEYMDEDLDWTTDPTGDLGRITRQQELMRKMVDRAAAKSNGFDVVALNSLLSSTTDNLKVDSGMDLSQMIELAGQFRDFRGENLRTHVLPVEQWVTNGGASVLRLDTVRAQPVLNIFRGLPPDAISPEMVTLEIENGSGVAGQAGQAQQVFESMGFNVEATANADETVDRTIVRYAPGAEAAALEVAGHLPVGVEMEVDESLDAGVVVVVTGRDFTSVSIESHPVDPSTLPSSTETSVANVDEELIDEPIGVVPEPTGTPCG